MTYRPIRTLLALSLLSCGGPSTEPDEAGRSSAIADSVRAFADTIAAGITARGPAAWRDYLADEPTFFMAAEGRLVFANSEAAARAIQGLVQQIARMELQWGDSLRVDPLGPGLALIAAPYHEVRIDAGGTRVVEDGYFTGVAGHGPSGWRLRNAHWSVKPPAEGR